MKGQKYKSYLFQVDTFILKISKQNENNFI